MNDINYLSKGFFGKLIYNIKQFFINMFSPIIRVGSIFRAASNKNKVALIAAYPVMGLGYCIQGKVEKGLINIALYALYIIYMISGGAIHITGRANLDYLNLQVIAIGFTLVIAFLYLRALSGTNKNAELSSKGIDVSGSSLAVLFKKLGNAFKNYFTKFSASFHEANIAIKISLIIPFFVMGIAQLIHKQIVKGLLYLALYLGFIAYMVFKGVNDLIGLVTLNVVNLPSHFSLLYGLLAIVIILAFLILYLSNLSTSLTNASLIVDGEKAPNFKQELNTLTGKKFYKMLLIIPILGAVTFTILPLMFMISIAFTDYGTSGTIPIMNLRWLSWTGFASFKKLFSLGPNLKALVNVFSWTMVWAFFATFTCYFGGILLAVLINKKVIKYKILFRSIFILTMAIPQFVSLRVMFTMFNDYGPVNTLLLNWGMITERIHFWDTPLIAKTLIISINMWVGIPYFMLLTSGLLINIPTDLYEYAKIEGAGKWYIFKKITMPYLLFMTTPLIITNFVSNINNFNVIWLLTGGGPTGQGMGGVAGGTDILITWLFKLTMQNNPEYNMGAAIGIIMFIISATLSLLIFRRTASYKKEEDFS